MKKRIGRARGAGARKGSGQSTDRNREPDRRTAGKKNGMPHSESLKGLDFLRVMAKGEKCSCPSFYLYYVPAGDFQAGVCVSRRLGGAVVRNRIKRILRESLRLTRNRLRRPCHLVLVARRGAEELSVEQAKDSLNELYGNARLVSEAASP